jgi:hypothetical protein
MAPKKNTKRHAKIRKLRAALRGNSTCSSSHYKGKLKLTDVKVMFLQMRNWGT